MGSRGEEHGGKNEIDEHVHVDVIILFMNFEIVMSPDALCINGETGGRSCMCGFECSDCTMSSACVAT